MPTDKLNLPLITENMIANVPRDMNALAEAVDDAAGTDLATLEADGMIPSSQMRPIPGLSTHMNDLIKHITFAEATGTANTYAVTISPAPSQYTDGLAIAVKINVDSTGAATLNVNGLGARPLRKANGNNALNLKRNGIYTFRYNSATTAFILQGEGGNGNAQPGDVLMGKTFSNDYGDQTGTMDLTNLKPENIKRDVTINNVTGTLYPDPVNTFSVGDDVVFSTGTSASNTGDSYRKIIEIEVRRGGDVRIKILARNTTNLLAYTRLYVNSTLAVENTHSSNNTGQTFTKDLTGVREGDRISLYARIPGGVGMLIIDSFDLCIGNTMPYAVEIW